MATIDKSLPNITPGDGLTVPTAIDLNQPSTTISQSGPVDVTENEDGSADVNIGPEVAPQQQ